MLSKLLSIFGALISVAAAVLYGLLQRSKAQRMDEQRANEKASKDTLIKANDALSKAEVRGKKRLKDAKNNNNRNHFS